MYVPCLSRPVPLTSRGQGGGKFGEDGREFWDELDVNFGRVGCEFWESGMGILWWWDVILGCVRRLIEVGSLLDREGCLEGSWRGHGECCESGKLKGLRCGFAYVWK